MSNVPVTLKQALGGMAAIPQFFVWRLVWSPGEGKFHKTPCFPDGSEYLMSAQDSRNWTDFDTAHAQVTAHRLRDPLRQYTLGFYLTVSTGYWFLDVDKCIGADGAWTPVAAWLYNVLPGAAFEYSSSRAGFHIFGHGVLPANHVNKPAGLGLELYSHDRGIAFGLDDVAYGCADCSDEVKSAIYHTVCPAYFPTNSLAGLDVDSVGPRADWRGPTDDEDLLRRARNSSSIASKFNAAKATFADLYDGNWTVLHAAYQDGEGGFAESEADMALAAHLAFWTGCDGERMERLMRSSALVRPKWDEHSTYLRKLTIGNARAKQGNVLQDKPAEPAGVVIAPDTVVKAEGAAIEGTTYLSGEQQAELFKGCVYVIEDNKVFVRKEMGFNLVGSEQFSTMFGNYSFPKDREGKLMAKNAFEAFARSTIMKYPYADRCGFRPDLEPGCIFTHQGFNYVNTYIPYQPKRVVGDVSPFLNHVALMLPDARDQTILLSYLAACVQHKGIKFKWCPVLQGLPGNGKSLLADFVSHALGDEFIHKPPVAHISSNFNDWQYEKLFIQVDEVRVERGKPEIMDTIKPMITDGRQQVEAKGGKKRMRTICCNFYMSMNDKANLIKEEGDRRFAIFYTAQQRAGDMERTGMGGAYMNSFIDWTFQGDGMAIVAEWLHTYQIPTGFNPATELLRCPATSSEVEVGHVSRDRVEVEILDAVEEGRPGFKHGWICWQRIKELFKFSPPPSLLERYLSNLGYVPHPNLKAKGWTNNPVYSENNLQVRIYCRNDHPTLSANLTHAATVNAYVADQTSLGNSVGQLAAPPPPANYSN